MHAVRDHDHGRNTQQRPDSHTATSYHSDTMWVGVGYIEYVVKPTQPLRRDELTLAETPVSVTRLSWANHFLQWEWYKMQRWDMLGAYQ